jgi:hypothetical protein
MAAHAIHMSARSKMPCGSQLRLPTHLIQSEFSANKGAQFYFRKIRRMEAPMLQSVSDCLPPRSNLLRVLQDGDPVVGPVLSTGDPKIAGNHIILRKLRPKAAGKIITA